MSEIKTKLCISKGRTRILSQFSDEFLTKFYEWSVTQFNEKVYKPSDREVSMFMKSVLSDCIENSEIPDDDGTFNGVTWSGFHQHIELDEPFNDFFQD